MSALPRLSRLQIATLIFVAVFAIANLGYQFWLSLHQAKLLEQAEPHLLILAVVAQILVYVAFAPAFTAFYHAHGIDLPFNSALRLIVSGMGLAKIIPLGEYLVWRRQLRHYPNGAAATTQFLIVYTTWTFALLGLIFGVSEVLSLTLLPHQLTESLASKFILLPLVLTGVGILLALLLRVRRLRHRIAAFCAKTPR